MLQCYIRDCLFITSGNYISAKPDSRLPGICFFLIKGVREGLNKEVGEGFNEFLASKGEGWWGGGGGGL